MRLLGVVGELYGDVRTTGATRGPGARGCGASRGACAEQAAVRVRAEMGKRRDAALERQRWEGAVRQEAVRAALQFASDVNARARLAIGKREREERDARAAAEAQVERAAKRQLEDWQSRRWADAWTAAFAARRAETLSRSRSIERSSLDHLLDFYLDLNI